MKNFSLCFFILLALPVHAVTYFVDKNGDGSDCLSWNNACTTLAAAVALSNDDVDDEIRVAQGTYYPVSGIVLKDNLTIRGGYNIELNLTNPEVYKTIFSGDKDGNDVNKVDDITLNHADIRGANLDFFIDASNLDNIILEGLTITGMNYAGTGGSAVILAKSVGTFNNIQFIGNKATGLGVMFVWGQGVKNSTFASINDSVFSGNSGGSGAGALDVHNFGHAVVNRTTFENNISGTKGGAIYVHTGESKLEVNDSLFLNNSAPYGGAIQIDDKADPGKLNNSTFFGNNATGNLSNNGGGAINIESAGHQLSYLTVVGNSAVASGGGILINVPDSSNKITASLVMGNSAGNLKNLREVGSNKFTDGGFNLIGAAGEESESTFTFGSNSNASTLTVAEVIELSIDDNGGARKSVKISPNDGSTDYARNRIPFTGIPFYGVGRSAAYPFTSLSQAKGALTSFDNYTADVYYFDIGAVYGDAASNYVVTPGVAAFSTYVDDEGFVLIASASSGNSLNDISESTSELFLTANKKLDNSIVTAFQFDESRIDGLNEWRRSSSGLCDGSVAAKDSRGLPKPGFVNLNDIDQVNIIEDCDIGAFEFNDAYRLDCYDEDGDRAGITVDEDISDGETSGSGSFCLNRNILNATPAEVLDNLGGVHYSLLLLLSVLVGSRHLLRKSSFI